MSRTGLRLGEALALQWGDLDFAAREIRVERAVSPNPEISTPKSGHGRTVDMATSVRDLLQSHRARLSEAWLRRLPAKDAQGNELPKGDLPPWVSLLSTGRPSTTRTSGRGSTPRSGTRAYRATTARTACGTPSLHSSSPTA